MSKSQTKVSELYLQRPEVVSLLATLQSRMPAPGCHGYSGVSPAPCQSGLA